MSRNEKIKALAANINPATYDRRYELVEIHATAKDLTLYEACKALEACAAAGTLTDVTHVRRDGRPVACFSEWHNETRAMFGAAASEREVIAMWRP